MELHLVLDVSEKDIWGMVGMEGRYNQWEESAFHKFSLTLRVSSLSSLMQSVIFLVVLVFQVEI